MHHDVYREGNLMLSNPARHLQFVGMGASPAEQIGRRRHNVLEAQLNVVETCFDESRQTFPA